MCVWLCDYYYFDAYNKDYLLTHLLYFVKLSNKLPVALYDTLIHNYLGVCTIQFDVIGT